MKQLKLFLPSHIRPALIAWGIALLISTVFVTVTTAHALLVKSEPEDGVVLKQAPAQVVTWFSQELDTNFSVLQVFDAEDRQVDTGDGGVDLYDPDHASMLVTLAEPLPNGTYKARWTVVSAEDGDLTEGEFTFRVGEASVAIEQGAGVQPLSVSGSGGWPLAWIAAAGLVVLVLAVTSLLVRSRLIRNN